MSDQTTIRHIFYDWCKETYLESTEARFEAFESGYYHALRSPAPTEEAIRCAQQLKHELQDLDFLADLTPNEQNALVVARAFLRSSAPAEATPSPTGTELALDEAKRHIATLTKFWMDSAGWHKASEDARAFISGIPTPAPAELDILKLATVLRVEAEKSGFWDWASVARVAIERLRSPPPAEDSEGLREALERLGSSEAFVTSRALHKVLDAELLARIEYARAALSSGRDGRKP